MAVLENGVNLSVVIGGIRKPVYLVGRIEGIRKPVYLVDWIEYWLCNVLCYASRGFLFASAVGSKSVVAVPSFGLIQTKGVRQLLNFKLSERNIILFSGLDLRCNVLRCTSRGILFASVFRKEVLSRYRQFRSHSN